MSRVGKKKINIPEGVNVKIADGVIIISGRKSQESFKLPKGIEAKISDNTLRISRSNETKNQKSLHGTVARVVENKILGLIEDFSKKLQFSGVGYTVNVEENKLNLRVGFSHLVSVDIPEDIEVTVKKNIITISGRDKEKVGEFAAKVREIRKPEVYKGKGIKYEDEFIKKKAGKAAQTTTTA